MTLIDQGTRAPDFELPDQDANASACPTFAATGRPLFYPEADTPGCTTQAAGSATTAPTTRPPAQSCSASPPTR